jgi:hypothetical protein
VAIPAQWPYRPNVPLHTNLYVKVLIPGYAMTYVNLIVVDTYNTVLDSHVAKPYHECCVTVIAGGEPTNS